jgi:hypothetical protein
VHLYQSQQPDTDDASSDLSSDVSFDAPCGEEADLEVLDAGTTICVRNRFIGNWSSGFLVAEVLDDGYRIQRLSDGLTFPDVFAFEDVRIERRHHVERGISGSYLDRDSNSPSSTQWR